MDRIYWYKKIIHFKLKTMKEALLKTEQLKKEGHTVFSFNENEIWYIDKDDEKLRCIYRKCGGNKK